MKIFRLRYLILACLLFLLGGAPASLAAQTGSDWRFGVVESYTAPNSARELGITWTRVSFNWANAQAAGPGTWTPEISEQQIDQEVAAGRLVVGLLIGIPEWARDENRLPRGLWLPHDDPHNSWGRFVSEVAQRYAGRIDHWIIWNEPDIDPTAIAHTWDGTVADFAQLQRVAYLAAKEANPEATIHLAAFTYWADVYAGREQYMARLLDQFLADPQAPQNNYYFDVATAHLYFQPDQIYELLLHFQEIMRERGIFKPIWLVETNAPPHDDPAWPVAEHTLSVMQDEQAAFMPQALASALAAGAERIGIYKMQDTVSDRQANPEPFGLLRLDGSRRPAFRALHVAMQYMGGSTEIVRQRWDEVGQFQLTQQDRTTTVLFARLADPQQAVVPAIADRALLVDLRGTQSWVDAEDGRYLVDLPPALCIQTIGDYCMIGGSTYYLIQSLDGSDPPEGPAPILPQPTSTPTVPASPTPTASATSTPSPVPSATPSAVPASPTPAPTQAEPSPTAPAAPTTPVPAATPPVANPATSGAGDGGQPETVFLIGGLLVLGAVLLGIWWMNNKRGR
jgi:hypothetical protein